MYFLKRYFIPFKSSWIENLQQKLKWPFHVTFDGIVRFSQFFVTQGTPKSEIICEIQINLIINNNCHFLPFLNLFTWIFVQNQSVILTNFLSHKVHQKANCNGMPRLWLCYNVFILHWFWPGLFMKLQQKIGRNLSLHFNAKEGHSEVECQFPVKPLFLVHNESSKPHVKTKREGVKIFDCSHCDKKFGLLLWQEFDS